MTHIALHPGHIAIPGSPYRPPPRATFAFRQADIGILPG
ncbi:Hypothetical protein CAP_4635 [Chondromyces apiculatus DSM 436]|uniref:Uncharacterized protein n=1 Tax=Chondromyces apiculatus DSM 436 TaxID=1192034 RepID=A0A017T6T2_9BACT|nr:Hypothetical protein CAP_4635 [Chondromyces apiculatus DSM 436]